MIEEGRGRDPLRTKRGASVGISGVLTTPFDEVDLFSGVPGRGMGVGGIGSGGVGRVSPGGEQGGVKFAFGGMPMPA